MAGPKRARVLGVKPATRAKRAIDEYAPMRTYSVILRSGNPYHAATRSQSVCSRCILARSPEGAIGPAGLSETCGQLPRVLGKCAYAWRTPVLIDSNNLRLASATSATALSNDSWFALDGF